MQGRVTGKPPWPLAHALQVYPAVPLPLTRQLLSSSADRMMVPHFFPGTPLEDKSRAWRAGQARALRSPGSGLPPSQLLCPRTPGRTAPREPRATAGRPLCPCLGLRGCPTPVPRALGQRGLQRSPGTLKASRLTRKPPDQRFSNLPSKDHFCGQKTLWAGHPPRPADPGPQVPKHSSPAAVTLQGKEA